VAHARLLVYPSFFASHHKCLLHKGSLLWRPKFLQITEKATPATLSGGIINIHTTQLLSFLEGVGLSCDWKEAAAGRQDMPMEEDEEANLLLSHLIISLRER
jgi:hypothetical protein